MELFKKNIKLVEEWNKGWEEGANSVLQFLKEMKNIDVDEEYSFWENADEYTKLNGKVVKRYN